MNKNQPSEDYKSLNIGSAKSKKIGIVQAEWNHHITSKLAKGVCEVFDYWGIGYEIIVVPGSFELPLGAQKLAIQSNIDAVICLGCVIQGDTKHFDYVCTAATNGILEVGLKFNKPVIFGVLTTQTEEQAFERIGGKHGHKGIEAAITAIKMINL